MNYEQVEAIDNLDVYVRTPGCWRMGISADLNCNVLQGLEMKLHNGVADGAKAEVWIYAHDGTRADAYIYTAHTFDFSDSCLLDYSAMVSRMLANGITAAWVDIDYTDAGNNVTNGKIAVMLRDGIWGMISPVVMPSRIRVLGGVVWRLSLANRTAAAVTYRRWDGGSSVETQSVAAQHALGLTIAAGGADAIEFGGVMVPVVEAPCGAVMLTWRSKEDGTDKSFAFDVMAEELSRDATAEVSVEGLKEWWQTGGGRKRLLLASCDWQTWRYIRDLNISNDIMMTVNGYDATGHSTTMIIGVRLASEVGAVPVNGTADIEFEVETWKEVAEWAR